MLLNTQISYNKQKPFIFVIVRNGDDEYIFFIRDVNNVTNLRVFCILNTLLICHNNVSSSRLECLIFLHDDLCLLVHSTGRCHS